MLPPAFKSPWIWFGLYALWFVVLWVLSSLSHPSPIPMTNGWDKVQHFTYFLIGAIFLGCGFKRAGLLAEKGVLILVPVIGAAVGWLDEWHQSMTPGRFGLDLYDWLADVSGSITGIFAARFVARKIPSPVQPSP